MATWLVTGCSAGLGRAIALRALERGDTVAVTARRPETLREFTETFGDRALALALDVTKREQVSHAVARALAHFGAIDVLVNNAGYLYRAAVEEGEDDEVRALFETNWFGALSMIQATLPSMRARRCGTIINISSDAGRSAKAGSGFYAATKFALEGLSEALSKEVESLGIKVMVVEPGAFRTAVMGDAMRQSKVPIDDYAETAGLRRKEFVQAHGQQRGDPAQFGRALLTALESPERPFRLVLGSDCLASVSTTLADQAAELDAWRDLSRSTDFPAGQ
jgi:NAD(P)-dependent dehydrogenase (short-subunit alcohol dehydrogenase family)